MTVKELINILLDMRMDSEVNVITTLDDNDWWTGYQITEVENADNFTHIHFKSYKDEVLTENNAH